MARRKTSSGMNARAWFYSQSFVGGGLLAGEADREYKSRIEAERCTLEFAQPSTKRIDAGKQPMSESPLFGGVAQGSMFEEEQ